MFDQGQRRGDAQVEEVKQGADIVLQDLGRGLRGPVGKDVLPPLRALLRHLAGAQAGFGVRRNGVVHGTASPFLGFCRPWYAAPLNCGITNLKRF